jgi:hypothetical protein
LLCVLGYVLVYATGRAGTPIRSDGFSYYVYLPSWFIHGDATLGAVADDCCGGEFPEFTAIIRWPGTGRWVNAHPIGVALMQAPLFLVAHGLTRWTNLSPDGFTLYYQHAAGLSGTLWTIAGLWLLSRVLRRHYSEGVTAATLVALLFGTNLYHYATFDSSYSHPYSFCLVAALLFLTERWHASHTLRDTILLGVVAGLIVLVRHTNLLVLALIPLYSGGAGGAGAMLRMFRQRRREMLLMALVAAAVSAPQLALYYAATGRPVVSSYGALGFDFSSPHLAGVLVGVRKGLFFWSPLLLLGAAGLTMLRGPARAFLLPSAVLLAVHTYVVASWWDWQFGGSYGHRGFIDLFPMFALGLARFFEWSSEGAHRLAIVTSASFLLVVLSTLQMLQYWNGILPMSDTTWAQYRAIFLRLR